MTFAGEADAHSELKANLLSYAYGRMPTGGSTRGVKRAQTQKDAVTNVAIDLECGDEADHVKELSSLSTRSSRCTLSLPRATHSASC